MPKTLFKMCGTAVAVFGVLWVGHANAAESGLFTYEVVDGKAEITAFPPSETGHLDIPSQLDGFPVVAITGTSPTQGAFRGSQLTSITIPDGVERLGSHAFSWSGVMGVSFPSTLKQIGANAFGASALGFRNRAVVLPDGLEEIGEGAFLACDFQQMTIPDSVTVIGEEAFANCKQMTFLEVGSGVAVLPKGAFQNCDGLKRVALKEGLVEIAEDCFMGSQIAEVTFPSTLTTLGENAFGLLGDSFPLNGGTLVRAVFKGNAPTAGSRIFANNSSEFVVNFLAGATGFTEPVWQGVRSHSVTVLPSDELKQFRDFTYREIDDEIEIVGYLKSFSGHVDIPSTIEGKPVTGITGAYRGNEFEAAFAFASLTSVNIPEGVEIIGNNAFALCPWLNEVTFPDSLRIIGPFGFYRTMIRELNFGSGLEVIGEFSFPNVTATELVIPDSVKKIGSRAFETCAARSLIVGSSVEEIGRGALVSNWNLKTILFKGDAPAELSGLIGIRNNEGLTIYYFAGAEGFTTPTWDVPGIGTLNTVEIGSLEPVEAWLISKGLQTSQDVNQTLSGSEASVLMSYALGMDPYQTDFTKMPSAAFAGGQLEMGFFAGRTDVNYMVEVSDDLSEWRGTGVTVSATDAQGMKIARVSGGAKKKYLRLILSLTN